MIDQAELVAGVLILLVAAVVLLLAWLFVLWVDRWRGRRSQGVRRALSVPICSRCAAPVYLRWIRQDPGGEVAERWEHIAAGADHPAVRR